MVYARGWLAGVVLAAVGCSQSAIPDPRPAAQAYARAIERRDVDALFELLDAPSRQALTKSELARLLATSYPELRRQARAFARPDAEVTSQVRVAYSAGRVAYLSVEGGELRIRSVDDFPAEAHTPIEALAQLRTVLLRRNYPALTRILTQDTNKQLEAHTQSLVDALKHPEALDIEVTGDTAVARTRGGHRVELKQEDGFWKIQDFE
jgi:hypothetical protein